MIKKLSDIRKEVCALPTTSQELEKLTEDRIKAFSTEDRFTVLKTILERVEEEEARGQSGTARRLLDRVDVFCRHLTVLGGSEDIRRQLWDKNHRTILQEIHSYLLQYGAMPPANELAKRCKLSRQTVYEHLKEGIAGKFYQEQLRGMEYLTENVLTVLYRLSAEGNVSAAKVYLENVIKITQPVTNIKQQNNYLQINNTKIDELTINELPEEARIKIEQIINTYKKTA